MLPSNPQRVTGTDASTGTAAVTGQVFTGLTSNPTFTGGSNLNQGGPQPIQLPGFSFGGAPPVLLNQASVDNHALQEPNEENTEQVHIVDPNEQPQEHDRCINFTSPLFSGIPATPPFRNPPQQRFLAQPQAQSVDIGSISDTLTDYCYYRKVYKER
jgi:hypothetical protein